MWLVTIMQLKGDFESAKENAREAARLAKDDETRHYAMALVRVLEDNSSEALNHLDLALKADPVSERVKVLQAEIRGDINPEQAKKDAFHLIEQHSKHSIGYILLGWQEFVEEESLEALTHFNQALMLNPEAKFLHMYRGFARLSLYDFEGAMEDFDSYVPFNSIDGPLLKALTAYTSFRMGQIGKSNELFDEALRLGPTIQTSSYYFRGVNWIGGG